MSCDLEDSCFDGLSAEQQELLSELLDGYFESLEQGRPIPREQLLAAHPELAGPLAKYLDSLDFLQDAAVGFGAAAEPTADGWDGPRQLGDFKIECEIGRGGMGIVYEAHQLSLDRRVAIKVLPFAALLDANQISRFRHEAQAAARLDHAHIVPVYAVGNERGIHYYAMKLIEGQPLDQVIDELRNGGPTRALPRSVQRGNGCLDSTAPVDFTSRGGDYSIGNVEDDDTKAQPKTQPFVGIDSKRDGPDYFRTVAQLGIQAAEALHAAHDDGIVHRDIKPSNLILDAAGDVWVTDFGLARCRSNAKLTRTGDLLGTMHYMSPEQTLGQAQLVDHRTDIYSLGLTLYELLTLRRAVRGDDAAAIVRHLDQGQPYRPRLWNPSIPVDLETIIEKAIAKSREDRYATSQEFADDLRRFLAGKPTIAKRPTLIDRVSKWARRHRAAVTAGVGILVLVAVGLLVSTAMLARETRRAQRAVHEASERFRQYRSQLALTNNSLGLLQDQNGETRQALASFQKAIQLQREILAEHPEDEQTLRELAATLSNLSLVSASTDPSVAETGYHEALSIQQRLVDQHPENTQDRADLALTASNLGAFYRQRGSATRAASYYRQSIELLTILRDRSSASPSVARDLAVCFNNLGMTQDSLGELPEAISSFEQALSLIQSLGRRDALSAADLSRLGSICSNLGMVYERQHKLADAARSYQRARQYQTGARDRAPQVARYRNLLGQHDDNHARVLRKIGQRAVPSEDS